MVSAKMVQELREKTGAGMMDCKRALEAADGDMEKAIENLRKAGVAKAEKKSGRATMQGKVLTRIADGKAAIVELLCETDFAAKTPKFEGIVSGILDKAIAIDGDGDITESLNDAVKDELTAAIATIGENMQLRRAIKWNGDSFGFYHHDHGRVSVLVEAEGAADGAVLNEVCMHIAAFSPSYICPKCVPDEKIAKEKEIAVAADPKLAGKPAEMLEKILMGKMARFFSEVCLVRQPWFKDDKTCLEKLHPELRIKRFVRWAVGEEI